MEFKVKRNVYFFYHNNIDEERLIFNTIQILLKFYVIMIDLNICFQLGIDCFINMPRKYYTYVIFDQTNYMEN